MGDRVCAWITMTILVGCAASIPTEEMTDPPAGEGDSAGEPDAGGTDEICHPPHLLVLLDRTESMWKEPDGSIPEDTPEGRAASKWAVAIGAVERFTADYSDRFDFGLALFPRDPGGGTCVTLSQRIGAIRATNPLCQGGEILVSPGPSASAAIEASLDWETTLLCRSTPIGAALATAQTELARLPAEGREQYVVFVGDGLETCNSALAISTAQTMAADGVRTFVISFDGSGASSPLTLDNLACAGQTARGFPDGCTDAGDGRWVASSPGQGEPLFYQAQTRDQLGQVLGDIADKVSATGCVD
jgi:hypothetical protein